MSITTATPTVSSVGKSKIRIEAESSDYRLGLWDAQELASSIALALEQIQHGYDMPHEPTRKRTLKISQRRSITVSGSRADPGIRLKHAPVVQLTTEQAHELIAVIVSAIEATEDHLEAKGVDPYGPL